MSFPELLFLEPSPKSLLFMQVSHHPPVSAFYVSNRKDGFCMSGSITAKSRFYGEEAPVAGGGGQEKWEENPRTPEAQWGE